MTDARTDAGRALFDSFRQSVPWDSLPARLQREYAEAAVNFLRWELTREPSEGMVDAGAPHVDGGDGWPEPQVRTAYIQMSRHRLTELGIEG